jgi:hypothetical protein
LLGIVIPKAHRAVLARLTEASTGVADEPLPPVGVRAAECCGECDLECLCLLLGFDTLEVFGVESSPQLPLP